MTIDDLKAKIAPTAPALAALLGGAVAGTTQANLGKALCNDDSANVDAIGAAIDTAGDGADAKFKEAENATFKQLSDATGNLEFAKLDSASAAKRLDTLATLETQAAADRANARAHQLQAKDWWTNPALAFAVTLGFFAVIGFCLWPQPKDALPPSAMAQTLLGVLGTAWVSIITYYFGSSIGSKEKTKLLATQLSGAQPAGGSPGGPAPGGG